MTARPQRAAGWVTGLEPAFSLLPPHFRSLHCAPQNFMAGPSWMYRHFRARGQSWRGDSRTGWISCAIWAGSPIAHGDKLQMVGTHLQVPIKGQREQFLDENHKDPSLGSPASTQPGCMAHLWGPTEEVSSKLLCLSIHQFLLFIRRATLSTHEALKTGPNTALFPSAWLCTASQLLPGGGALSPHAAFSPF